MSTKAKATRKKKGAKSMLVPKLRFPEFREAEGWKHVPLDQIAGRVTTRNFDGDCTRVLTNSAEHGVLDQRDYFEKDIATLGNLDGYYIVDRGDYVYNPRISNVAPVGPISRNNIGRGVMSPLYTIFRFNSENTDFYSHYFKTTCWHSYLRQVASTGARHDRMSISVGDFVAMPLPTPSTAEQKKVAACLSSVDELIAAQARKVDALNTHKKGLMQQLFPREGETQPRLRFPEFQRKERGKERPLGQVIKIVSGQVDPTRPPYCDSLQVGSENIESNTGKLINVKSAGDKGIRSGNYAFDENDILYSKIRPALNKVAAPRFKGICSADIYPVRPANGDLLRSYLMYLLLSQKFLDYAILNSERGKIPKINRNTLLAFSALIPLPIEQQRIADCLSSLDDLISAQTQKFETLKLHKKGLMQQLFPSPEGVEA